MSFGAHKYRLLPMGVTPASNIFQGIMDLMLHHIKEICLYIDDIRVLEKN